MKPKKHIRRPKRQRRPQSPRLDKLEQRIIAVEVRQEKLYRWVSGIREWLIEFKGNVYGMCRNNGWVIFR